MFKILKNEVTQLNIIPSKIIEINNDSIWVSVTDYGVFVKTDYQEKNYSLISEDEIKKWDPLELNILTEGLFLKSLERNVKILNGAHKELENILYSESLNFTPKKINNIKLSNAMTQYFKEVSNVENIINDKKTGFTEHFMLLYEQYLSSFVNGYPKNERKEITDYLLTPINITISKKRNNDKNFEINYKIIIDKDKGYLMDKSLIFKKFSNFLSKKGKERNKMTCYVLKRLNRDMPRLAMSAIWNIQEDIKNSEKGQEIVEKIEDDKNRKIALMNYVNKE